MRVKLIDVSESIFAGGDVPKDRFSEIETDEYKIPIYANAEKDDGLYGYTDIARVSVPCVTVAARGTIGFTAKRIKPFLPVVRLITVIPDKEKITLDYLYYALRNCKPKSSGTSIPQLTVPDIKNYSFQLVSISRQNEITQILDKVKLLIEMQKKQMDYYDSLIKARFVEMFMGKDYPYFKLQDVCTKITDGEHGTVERHESGKLYLMARNITADGQIDLREVSYISEKDHAKIYSRCNPERGDLLLVCVGATIGKMALVPVIDEFSMARSVALIKPSHDKLNSYFLMGVMQSDDVQAQIKNSIHSSAQGGLYTKSIQNLKITVPPLELQEQFAAFVTRTAKLKLATQKSLDETQTLMGSLMQKYFD